MRSSPLNESHSNEQTFFRLRFDLSQLYTMLGAPRPPLSQQHAMNGLAVCDRRQLSVGVWLHWAKEVLDQTDLHFDWAASFPLMAKLVKKAVHLKKRESNGGFTPLQCVCVCVCVFHTHLQFFLLSISFLPLPLTSFSGWLKRLISPFQMRRGRVPNTYLQKSSIFAQKMRSF